jgi:hypothetical protein
MTILVLSNLYLSSPSDGVVHAQEINKVFVIYLNEGPLDTIVPGIAPFLFELSGLGKNSGNGTRNNTHTIIRVRGVSVEVDTSHGKCFPATCLAISENCAVKAFNKAGDERKSSGSKESVLGS